MIETQLGVIEVEIDTVRAPVTAANFLRYVDAGHYNGGRFHRTVRTQPDNQPRSKIKIDVIQGGVNPKFQDAGFGPIPLERTSQTGLRHTDGAISMARTAPDSAVSDFFLCLGDQPELDFGGRRNPDGQGFAAFGRVRQGMEVVRRIHQSPAAPSGSTAAVAAGHQRLDPPVEIIRIRRK